MPDVDKFSQRRFFERSISTVEKADFLYREVQSRLLYRLQGMKLPSRTAVDFASLQTRPYFPSVSNDTCLSAVETVVDVEELASLMPSSFGLMYSNLTQSLEDLATFFTLGLRALIPNGLLLFSLLGPSTLKELGAAFGHDAFPHVHRFYDMHDVGDLLLSSGYASPVMEASCIRVNYSSLEALFRDLRYMGVQCASQHRRHGLTGKGVWHAMHERYVVNEKKRYPVTIEVILGHAWKPAVVAQQRDGEEVRVNMDNIVRRDDGKNN